LSLDSNSIGELLFCQILEGCFIQVAENTVIERTLVLVDSATSSCRRVGPVDL
jgi:hypothetical protein